MAHVLALDQGTTSSRAILFDGDGNVRALAQKEFRQIYPRPGWVEHDAEEIWTTQIEAAAEALAEAGLAPADVAAAGITNQRETTVLWDRATGEPVHNAIVWQDRRTASHCDELRTAGHEDMVQESTGLLLDPYFSGTKLAWLLDRVEGVRERAEAGQLAFGTIDTWLVWKLTGGGLHLTDPSNASRTLLFNLARGDWDDHLLALLRIPRAVLPEVRSSSEVYGEASVDVLRGVPIAGIAGDQQAALFGQACFEEGLAKNTYGTGCFALMNIGSRPRRSQKKLLTTVAWKLGDELEYALEGSVFVGGAVVQWLRDGLGLIESAPEVEELAASVDDTGDVYLVPAFTGLGAPHWDPYARGTLVGLTRGTTGGHIARAALESIAFQVADILDAMTADSGVELQELRVDGGATRNDLLLQLQADFLGVPLARSRVTETTALGAAYLAGLAVGVWQTPGEIATAVERRFEPAMSRDEAASRRARWTTAVERAKAWAIPEEA